MRRILLLIITILLVIGLWSALASAMSTDAGQDEDEEDSNDTATTNTPSDEDADKVQAKGENNACPLSSPDEDVEDDLGEETPLVGEYIEPDSQQAPFADLSDEQIKKLLKENPNALGSMSVGYTNSGALFNGVQMPEGPYWTIVNSVEAWGTQETIDFITKIINEINEEIPNTPPLRIGDISDKDGGHLNRHASHQAGRDVDLGWYYKNSDCGWYVSGTQTNLDLARNWALVRAMFTETDVELILIDKSIQKLFYKHALSVGEDRDWLNKVFQYPNGNRSAIIRHARGHKTHVHVRFYNRKAQEMGRRAYRYMLAKKMIKPPTYYVYHKVRKGQTLGHLAKRYGTSVSALKRANGLRSSLIRAGKSYRILKRGGVKPAPNPAVIPPRRVPPSVTADKPVPVVKMAAVRVNTDSLRETKETNGKTVEHKAVADTVNEPAAKNQKTPEVSESETPMVPLLEEKEETKTAMVETDAVVSVMKSTETVAPALPAPKPKKAVSKKKSSKKWITYRVRSGENLWLIARKNGLHVKDIKHWNHLTSDKIKPGQKLRLYVRR